MAGLPLASVAWARIWSAAAYSGTIAARPSTISRTMNRTLRRSSPSSLAAMTRQPPCGTRSSGRGFGAFSAGAGTSLGTVVALIRASRFGLSGFFSPSVLFAPAGRPVPRRLTPVRLGIGRSIGGAVDLVERGDDRADGGQAEAPGRRRRPGCPVGRVPRRSPAGHGPATSHCPGRQARRTRPRGSRGAPSAARSTSACGRQLEADLDDRRPVTELPGQLVDRSDADQAAGGEDPDPVADRLDLAEQVARQHDRQTTLVDELAQEVEDLDDAERIDRGRRLVEDQQVRRLDQRVGDAEPLAHAARVLLDRVVGPIGQPDLLEDLVDGRLGLVAPQPVEAGRVAQVLAAGQSAVEADRVGQVADPALDLARLPGRVEAHHAGLARCRLGQAEQHQDRRRLAGPVLPEQAEDLARVDRQVELVDRGQVAVFLGQAAGPDDRLGPVRVARRPARRPDRPSPVRVGGCDDLAHRRPKRRKTSHRPSRTTAIRPIPMTPHSADVWTVTRMSVVAVASGDGGRHGRHVVAGDRVATTGVTWATTWTVWPAGTSTGVGSNLTTQPVGALAVIATPGMSAVAAVRQREREVGRRAGGAHSCSGRRSGSTSRAVAAGDGDLEVGVGLLAAARHVDRDRIVAGRRAGRRLGRDRHGRGAACLDDDAGGLGRRADLGR